MFAFRRMKSAFAPQESSQQPCHPWCNGPRCRCHRLEPYGADSRVYHQGGYTPDQMAAFYALQGS